MSNKVAVASHCRASNKRSLKAYNCQGKVVLQVKHSTRHNSCSNNSSKLISNISVTTSSNSNSSSNSSSSSLASKSRPKALRFRKTVFSNTQSITIRPTERGMMMRSHSGRLRWLRGVLRTLHMADKPT